MTRLIVGLGNPGTRYQETRHNLGASVVQKLGEKNLFPFQLAEHLKGYFGQGVCQGVKTALLLPTTYMNHSGEAVRACVDYFKIAVESDLLIVVDDVALPFGKFRFRGQGSAAGHNGLKSIEAHLGTQCYPRLKIGIGGCPGAELAQYVLGKFTPEERVELPKIVERGVDLLEAWIVQGPTPAFIQRVSKLD